MTESRASDIAVGDSVPDPACLGVADPRTEAAPASAISHSPARIAWQARCTATSDVEQAVCTLMLGPVRLSL